jgi:capsule polysaccharide modification protein KpsS
MNTIVITWRLARYIDSYVAEDVLLYTFTVPTPNFPDTGYYTVASTSLVTIAFSKLVSACPVVPLERQYTPPHITRYPIPLDSRRHENLKSPKLLFCYRNKNILYLFMTLFIL